jgi:hypothetical protein
VHGGTSDRYLVKALEVVGDSAWPEVMALAQVQDLAHDLAWEWPAAGSSAADRKIFNRHAVSRACSAFVIALRSRVIALRKELNVSPFNWDFTVDTSARVLDTDLRPIPGL